METSDIDDTDPVETGEWIGALKGVLEGENGTGRVPYLFRRLYDEALRMGVDMPPMVTSPYVNTISKDRELSYPGDAKLEAKICAYICWNAIAMVLRGNTGGNELGGHIATFQSAQTLYGVGFSHFWRAAGASGNDGDLVYMQGHSAPGIYARAFLEGRISRKQLENFRREVDGEGISSYPHPRLMPNFWQFPTVSMGLGLLMGIYQAKFFKYLRNRGILDNVADRKVWVFAGDGELDEPEGQGAISVASREGLDNLIVVVNCNLQRLDGPVRGNGKIIQELEAHFRGIGWNVIKVITGSAWDSLLEKDATGKLHQLMSECLDGDYQTFKSRGGAYCREKFFGRYPETKKLVESYSDSDLENLLFGGHDHLKVYSAYHSAVSHVGSPTVILAKTVKGFGMSKSGEAEMFAHQAKKMDEDSLLSLIHI